MKQLLHPHRYAISNTRNTLHCIGLAGVALLIVCTPQSAALAASGPVSADTEPSAEAPFKQRTARYTLKAEALHEMPQEQLKPKPFRLLAPGSERARIVNEQGEVVRSAAPARTIYTIRFSPDAKWFILYMGDAEYSIVSTESLIDIASPPAQPEGPEDATAFAWSVLDNDHLIGQAGLPSLDTEGLTAAEVESLPPRDTLIYVYTISSNTMTQVDIDGALSRPFHIRGVTNGQIELLHYETSEIFGAKIVPSPTR